jgi:SH3 domain-binding protein 5 (SH3BP5)
MAVNCTDPSPLVRVPWLIFKLKAIYFRPDCHFRSQVNESEVERNLSAEEHRAKSQAYQLAEQRVQDLQRNLKRSIHKSR